MQPYPEESNIVKDYMLVAIVVCLISVLWIFLNEVVIKIANVGIEWGGIEGGSIINTLILVWRILPIVTIIGVLAWAFMRATKHEPYQQWGY